MKWLKPLFLATAFSFTLLLGFLATDNESPGFWSDSATVTPALFEPDKTPDPLDSPDLVCGVGSNADSEAFETEYPEVAGRAMLAVATPSCFAPRLAQVPI